MKSHNYFNDPEFQARRKRGRLAAGLILIGFGSFWMAHRLGYKLPDYLLHWSVFLMGYALYRMIRNSFKHAGDYLIMLIGGIFLTSHIYPEFPFRHILWPALVIAIGVFLILKTVFRFDRHRNAHYRGHEGGMAMDDSTEDVLNVQSIFGGVEKSVVSKNFKGGRILCIFGGAEISLMQSDMNGTANLDITNVFGGTELSIPSDWKVVSEVTNILGGLEDKRPIHPAQADSNKVLYLKGTSIFGGVEIKGF